VAESIAKSIAKRKAEDAVEWVSDPYGTDDDGNSADDDGNTHCEVQFIETI
jgi:hypothetical protein